jgi:poly-gamma-glutamate capsule biosynthesis protein CapA/YwtB (metallophosphatase superfamily)
MYFVTLDSSKGSLRYLRMFPTRIRRFRLNRASEEDMLWLKDTLNREGERFGTRVETDTEGMLILRWD